ncbi:hypothetical protein BGY98DRAFT_1040380, partial [Russula aff. rugulosa BPL654]
IRTSSLPVRLVMLSKRARSLHPVGSRRTRTPSRKCAEEGWTECWCRRGLYGRIPLDGKVSLPRLPRPIMLHGWVPPIGGIREKVLGAHHAGWQQGDQTVGESERC